MRARICILTLSLIFLCSITDAATITIVNKDGAGVGFNDTTAAAPVGGNPGLTLGAQRLNVFNAAAAIWGAKLKSDIPIRITARFGPLTCTETSGVLGSAAPANFFRNFTNAPRANTWYPVALASALSGTDLALSEPDGESIDASFNGNLGNAGCLTGLHWYLGLDGNHGSDIDLETKLLHEFAHGLGFLTLVNLDTGTLGGGGPDIFAHYILDNGMALHWDVMSDAQRLASATGGNVVFDGSNVTVSSGILSAGKDGAGHAKLYAPNPLEPGSSISHFDISAFPNQLMEPSISGDLTHSVDLPEDLTMKEMLDIGWESNCIGTITLSPATLPNGTTGSAYAQTITASGGTAAYSFAVTAGTIPTGMTLSAAGSLSGTPTQSGTFTPTIKATDANGCSGTRAYTFALNCPTITISPLTLASAARDVAYSAQTLTQTGGVGTVTWSVSAGALPTGMSLSAGGVLSGTPTVAGSFPFTARATDANGCAGTFDYTLSVTGGCGTITLAPASLPAGTIGIAYSQTITSSGGTAAYTYAKTGALPAGVTLSTGGVLSGTPTQTGSFGITVTATDAATCTGSKAYTLTINCPTITLSPGTLTSATAGTAYSKTITASGGTGPYTYELTSGALPVGLSLSTAGVLSGTTAQTGTFPLTIRATDGKACTGSAAYSLSVVPPGAIVPGDANHDGSVDVTDIFYLINFLFASGPTPF